MFRLGLSVGVVAMLGIIWGSLLREGWLRAARKRAETEIARNRARYRPGMTTMNEQLRDKTTRRRLQYERALEETKRGLRDERPRLHKVS